MGFALFDLLKLRLDEEQVPTYSGRIPTRLVALCFTSSIIKLSIPLILEETYSSLTQGQDYVLMLSAVLTSIALSHLVLIGYSLMLQLYRLNVKRELSARIVSNNFQNYHSALTATQLKPAQQWEMELWVKSNTKLAVYLHNYYESWMSLIFECFNVAVISVYLLYKLSYSLLFGVAVAAAVMYKTIKTTQLMQEVRFGNIELRARRLKVLENFFNRISEFKMAWLDKWIFDRVTLIDEQYLSGLRRMKMLDCWCVALWQFTSVGISSMVIIAYFTLGLNEGVDKDSVFTPSTFVYLLNMLNFPLNALSWYVAGIRTAHRAISQIKEDIKMPKKQERSYEPIRPEGTSLVIAKPIELTLKSGQKGKQSHQTVQLQPVQLPTGKVCSVKGDLSELFMQKLVFMMDESVPRSYVEENSWLAEDAAQACTMQTSLSQSDSQLLGQLMQLFECWEIPLSTNTQNYSGGEKLRMSLVRAFYLGSVVVINSTLKSLDAKMQTKVKNSIRALVAGKAQGVLRKYTVFIRQNQDIADCFWQLSQSSSQKMYKLFLSINQSHQRHQLLTISQVSEPISNYLSSVTKKHSLKFNKIIKQENQLDEPSSAHQQSIAVGWGTFTTYYRSYKHLIFVVSMIAMTLLSNYYNYYINTHIELTTIRSSQLTHILFLTLLFAVTLFFRSYYFADANLAEADRITCTLNQNVIMNELSFYHSQNQHQEQKDAPNSKSTLICALTSDTQTIADHFPFSTNILANNIVNILSAVVVILIQVPKILPLMAGLIYYAHYLNRQAHHKDELMKVSLKKKEEQLYKIVADMEGGKKYLLIHRKTKEYQQKYARILEEFMKIEWLSEKFKSYINLKYKIGLVLFLVAAVGLYSAAQFDELGGLSKTPETSGLALIIQYTLQLSNYLLHFTTTLWDIRGQAVSIQRVTPHLKIKESILRRVKNAEYVINKLHQQAHSAKLGQKQLLEIQELDFAYPSNPDVPIFKGLNMQIKKGDKVMIKGRSGAGKTTLYKLLTSCYPEIMTNVDKPYHISFSPQHPLILPDTTDIMENINPYSIKLDQWTLSQDLKAMGLQSHVRLEDMTYDQKIMVNNIRAYHYGRKGITIYDEPQAIPQHNINETYLFVTHHHNFPHSQSLHLADYQLKPNQ